MPATATSQDAPNSELAALMADQETDIMGVAKVEINEGTTEEEKGLLEGNGPGKLTEHGVPPKH